MFEKQEQTPNNDYLAALVGEDKKYKTVDELAKAYANADAKIMADAAELAHKAELETELAITKRLLDAANTRVPLEEKPVVKPETPVVTSFSEEDLDARITKTLADKADKERRESNQQVAAQRLVEAFGNVDNAKAAIATRAQELGVSAKWLEDTAASSPNAFFATMGLTSAPATKETPAPKGDVNMEALLKNPANLGIKPGTYKYYQNLRKQDPKLYASPATQRQMHNDAMARGAEFYT